MNTVRNKVRTIDCKGKVINDNDDRKRKLFFIFFTQNPLRIKIV